MEHLSSFAFLKCVARITKTIGPVAEYADPECEAL